MIASNLKMISVLRETARRLTGGAEYNWSHQGNCNCGHLVQTVTKLSKAEIHARALEKAGDWGEKVVDYCPTSNYPIDHIITTMLEMGFTRDDLVRLERLSAPDILDRIPHERKPLKHNCREDVILYMNTWADLLEEKLLDEIELPRFDFKQPRTLKYAEKMI
ncbi:hypothetical protein IH824_09770 [candidate division KSB1 bacterium]|nr:hypothetical protein [candidate division KSB1 bacterium]